MDVRLLAQGGIVLGLGAAMQMMRQKMKRPPHPSIPAEIVQRAPQVADIMTVMADVGDEETLNRIGSCVCELISLERVPNSSWRMARLCGETLRHAKSLCTGLTRHSTEDEFRRVLLLQDDLIPQLAALLDDMVHNHLLAKPM